MAETQENSAPRVAQLLSAARRRHHRSEQDVAVAVGVPVGMVRRWERGTEVPTDDQLERLGSLYAESPDELIPSRNVAVLDAHNGTLTVGSETAEVDLDGGGNEAMLQQYVSMVRGQRNLADNAVLDLRDEDIGALASVLDLTDTVLHRRLERIVGLTAAEAAEVAHKMRRWRYLAPLAGVAVGALGIFGVTQAFGGKGSTETPSAPVASVVTQLSGANGVASGPVGSTVTVPSTVSAVSPAVSSLAPVVAATTAPVGRSGAPTGRSSSSPTLPRTQIGEPLVVTPDPTTVASTEAPVTAPPSSLPGAVAVPGNNNDPSVTTPSTPPSDPSTTIPVDIGAGGTQVTAP